jgi:hypothetical protein
MARRETAVAKARRQAGGSKMFKLRKAKADLPKPEAIVQMSKPLSDHQENVKRLLVAALRRFHDNYPKGLSPQLDEAHKDAAAALAAAEKTRPDRK